ncbi:hypothetical protein L2E82_22527 [Cichorium intybus]|uniref:Uncharacterized protein n=1 Tax=Cichorium intybus TaxID=13427 RepID=A0ACB9DY80_CICIN|nr:hypothetical protein L2E82_22527 [Cichorium intybus]
MGKKWRHWKGSLKARAYDPSLTIDEIVAQQKDNDNRVNPEQFKELVVRWFDPEYQRTCDVKRTSRLKMQEPHVMGTKSFARLAHEEATKNNGAYPTRGEIYRISHTHKDGSIVNDNVAQIVSSIQAISSDVLDNLNFEVPVSFSMAHNNSPLGNVRSPSESHHNNGTCS